MARSDTVTLIPLDSFAKILGLDPLHFNSVFTVDRGVKNACDDMFFQHDWQDAGRTSRDDLALALKSAEEEVAGYLGYYPLPKWIKNEPHRLPRPARPEVSFISTQTGSGLGRTLRLNYGFVVTFGQISKTLVEAGTVVTYTDPDGDGYNELATVSVTTTVTTIEDLKVYFPGKSGSDAWEIRPVDVAISSGVATITFPKYLAVDPDLWETLSGNADAGQFGVNGDEDTNFITTVDVYSISADPASQLTFYSEKLCATCNGTGCDACDSVVETGCMRIRDRRLSTVGYERSNWNTTTSSFDTATFAEWRLPERVDVWYRAGMRNEDSDYPSYRIKPEWERAIIYYALTKLDKNVCSCDNQKRIIMHMRTDLAKTTDAQTFTTTFETLNTPLGTTRAAVMLWKMITAPGIRLGTSR